MAGAGSCFVQCFTTTILVICLAQPSWSIHDFHLESDEIAAIEQFVQRLMRCRDNPGLSLAIVKHGTMVLQKGYGMAEREQNVPVRPHTLFAIGSLTKAFTATLLAMLMEQHKNITWHTPIKDILDDFRMPTQYMTDHVTLTDIVAHRTGLPRNDLIWVANEFSQDEMVRRLRYFKPQEKFRTKLVYTNTAYSVLGLVVKKLTGKSWEENIKERIFRPLGMRTSTFYDRGRPSWRYFAKPYGKDAPSDPLWPVDQHALSGCKSVGPATSISSSARDMSRWLEFITRNGEYNETYRMLSDTANHALFEPIAALTTRSHDGSAEQPIFPVTRSVDTYSLGWTNGFYRGHRIYSHAGSMFGYESLITILPDESAAIYSNFNGPMGQGGIVSNLILHYFISDVLLGKEPWLDTNKACTYPLPYKDLAMNFTGIVRELPINKTAISARPLTEYVGQYGNYGLGNVTVAVNSTSETLQMNYGRQGKFLLFPNGTEDFFYVEAIGHLSFIGDLSSKFSRYTWVQFRRDKYGIYTKVRVSMFNWFNPPVFERDLILPPDTSSKYSRNLPNAEVGHGCACSFVGAKRHECNHSTKASHSILYASVMLILAFSLKR